jgi:hypothetical protein
MAPIRHHIDRCMIFCGAVIVSGWYEKRGSGPTQIQIEHKGRRLLTCFEEVYRQDLHEIYGGDAGSWGFTARTILPSGQGDDDDESSLLIRIRSCGAEETIIERPSQQFLPGELAEFRGVFEDFIRMVNERGGRVLEIGARARSGVTRRERFRPPLEYVGFDISPGPNVDVVGDAHHLSRFVTGKFTAAFSISTFEHLLMPWKVVLELNKLLDEGALVFTHTHQTYPLHETPWDFWRLSQDAWHGLYNRHTGFEIIKAMHAERAFLSAAFVEPHFRGLDRAPCYLGSNCIARKIGNAEVAWETEMYGIYDLAYNHGPTA